MNGSCSPGAGTGRRTLIIGAGDAGSLLLREIRRQAKPSYAVIGFVDDDLDKQGLTLHGLPVLGTTAQLKGILRKYRIEKVIIAIPSATGKMTGELVKEMRTGPGQCQDPAENRRPHRRQDYHQPGQGRGDR